MQQHSSGSSIHLSIAAKHKHSTSSRQQHTPHITHTLSSSSSQHTHRWIILSPTWVHIGLLWMRWHLALRSILATTAAASGEREEERAAKLGALAAAAGLGVLFTVCFLLLSLRLGGQAHYAAPYIAAPLFGSLALVACCCCCVACVARAATRAQFPGPGDPPYTEVREDEEAAGGGGGGGGGSSSNPHRAEEAPAAASNTPQPSARTGGFTAEAPGAADASTTEGESASRMAEAVDLGQQFNAASPESGSSSNIPVIPPPAPALSARLQAMSTKELKAELTSLGVAHEHCLEKSELAALLAAQGV